MLTLNFISSEYVSLVCVCVCLFSYTNLCNFHLVINWSKTVDFQWNIEKTMKLINSSVFSLCVS